MLYTCCNGAAGTAGTGCGKSCEHCTGRKKPAGRRRLDAEHAAAGSVKESLSMAVTHITKKFLLFVFWDNRLQPSQYDLNCG